MPHHVIFRVNSLGLLAYHSNFFRALSTFTTVPVM